MPNFSQGFLVTGENYRVLAVLRNVVVERKEIEVKSGYRGVVRARIPSDNRLTWHGQVLGLGMDGYVNLLNKPIPDLKLLCPYSNNTNSGAFLASKILIRVVAVRTNYSVVSASDELHLSGECLADEDGNLYVLLNETPQLLTSDLLPPKAELFVKQQNDAPKGTELVQQHWLTSKSVWGGALLSEDQLTHVRKGEVVMSEEKKKLEPSKPTVPVFPVKRDVDFDD